MKYLLHLLRKYPISAVVTGMIWTACLIPVPETPLSNVTMIDKWTHLVMFGGLCIIIWIERAEIFRKTTKKESIPATNAAWKAAFGIFFFAWTTGGLIELAQGYLTNGIRSGEWLDFYADGIGALLGQPTGILLARFLSILHMDA